MIKNLINQIKHRIGKQTAQQTSNITNKLPILLNLINQIKHQTYIIINNLTYIIINNKLPPFINQVTSLKVGVITMLNKVTTLSLVVTRYHKQVTCSLKVLPVSLQEMTMRMFQPFFFFWHPGQPTGDPFRQQFANFNAIHPPSAVPSTPSQPQPPFQDSYKNGSVPSLFETLQHEIEELKKKVSEIEDLKREVEEYRT